MTRLPSLLRVRRATGRWTTAAPDATGGSPRWVSGVLAGAQAALLSFLVVVVPTIAAYVATSADPTNADVGWPRAAVVGAALWLLGHGAVLDAGEARITLVPLGITALALFAAYASARRSAHRTRSAWLAGITSYTTLVALAALAAGATGPLGAGPGAVLRLTLGAVAVAAVGLGAGTLRARDVREGTRVVWERVPALVRTGAVAGTLAAALVLVVAAVVTAGWVVAGRAAAGDVVDGLGLDLFGGALLAVAQSTLAPNLVLWVVAWLAGPGFAVGEGTVFAPSGAVSGPMPALPILGALPADGSGGGVTAWAPVALVAVGGVVGWWRHRTRGATRVWEPFASAAATGLTAGLWLAAASLLAGGSAGPGRFDAVGADPLVVGLSGAALVALGAALVGVPAEAVVRRSVAAHLRSAWRRLREPAVPASAHPAAQAEPAVPAVPAGSDPTDPDDDATEPTGRARANAGPRPAG